jgi:hypothetical protein
MRMSEIESHESLEEQRDWFTFFMALFFVCMLSTLAHGFMGFAALKAKGCFVILQYVALFVFPGLLSGFVWHKWGVVIGAGMSAAVRTLAVINFGFLVPYAAQQRCYSFEAAVKAMPNFLLVLLFAVVLGAATGAVGFMLAEARYGGSALLRWARKIGMAMLSLALVVAGGIWLFGFLPFGKKRGVDALLSRMEKICDFVDTPLSILACVGLGLVVLCTVIAAFEAPKTLERLAAEHKREDG